jgi:surface protein
MFLNCFALTDINISNWNVGNLGNTEAMFKNCFALKTLDLSGWTLREEGGINASAMFKMEEASYKITPTLTTIYVGSGWNKDKINSNSTMFEDCTSLVGVTSKGVQTVFNNSKEGSDYAYVGEGGYLSEKK